MLMRTVCAWLQLWISASASAMWAWRRGMLGGFWRVHYKGLCCCVGFFIACSKHLNVSELHTEHVKKDLLPLTTISIRNHYLSTRQTKCAFSLGDLSLHWHWSEPRQWMNEVVCRCDGAWGSFIDHWPEKTANEYIIHALNHQFLRRSIDSSIKVEILLLKAGFTLNALKEKFGAGILLRELLGESTRDTCLASKKNIKNRYRVNIWGGLSCTFWGWV